MANANTGNRGNESRVGGTNPMGNVQHAADKARDAARGATETARETATGVMDRARDAAGNVAETARDWAHSAVDAVKDNDAVNKASDYVQDAWETSSKYLHEHNIKDMTDEIAAVIRRNPIPALLVGVGLGFILARSMRS